MVRAASSNGVARLAALARYYGRRPSVAPGRQLSGMAQDGFKKTTPNASRGGTRKPPTRPAPKKISVARLPMTSELHRLRAVFLTALGSDETLIEASFCEAMTIAREQKAASIEKRAEGSYAEYRQHKARALGSKRT